MKTDNLLGGRYLAEITHELFQDLRDTKYQNSEPRLSIYGRAADEWAKLAAWAVNHKIYSDNVRWLIQVPRLYSMYRKSGTVESFQVRAVVLSLCAAWCCICFLRVSPQWDDCCCLRCADVRHRGWAGVRR